MYTHVVLWNLKEGKTKEDFLNIKEKMDALNPIIPELKHVVFALNEAQKGENSRQISLITLFENEEDYIVYRDHEEHAKVKLEIGKVFKDRIVSDCKVSNCKVSCCHSSK